MRILLCVNYDLIGCYALNKLLPRLCPQHEVQVFLSDRLMKHKDKQVDALDMLQSYERDAVVDKIFPRIDENPPEKAALYTFAGLSKKYDIPVEIVKRINSAEGVERFKEAAPDCILSIRYGYVFRQPLIDIPRYGIFNTHSGILPAYRGTMPTFRAMMNGAPEAGITLHRVPDAGIDTGEVIDISKLPINPNRSMLWHVMELYPLAAKMISKLVEDLSAGKDIKALPQNEGEAAYYTFPTDEEIQAFADAGFTLIQENEYKEWMMQFSSSAEVKNILEQLFLDDERNVA